MKTRLLIYDDAVNTARQLIDETDAQKIDTAILGAAGNFSHTGKDYDLFKQNVLQVRQQMLALKRQPAPSEPPPARPGVAKPIANPKTPTP